jgi:hypothetical protein
LNRARLDGSDHVPRRRDAIGIDGKRRQRPAAAEAVADRAHLAPGASSSSAARNASVSDLVMACEVPQIIDMIRLRDSSLLKASPANGP